MGYRKPMPSGERLVELFSYDPNTGILKRKKNFGSGRAGSTGWVGNKGYILIGLEGGIFLVHRIIWKMMTGADPKVLIDHRDSDRANNRWSNLREATHGQNLYNGKFRKNNTSGVKGVCWDRANKVWGAFITADGKARRLGRFETKSEAASVVAQARARLHGEFARHM